MNGNRPSRAQKETRGQKKARVASNPRFDHVGLLSTKALQALFDAVNTELTVRVLRKGSPGRDTVVDRRKQVVPKYRNPRNPAQTWSGRGAQPLWVKDALAAGKTLSDLRFTMTLPDPVVAL
ncbi:MAG TPA: H-NS histone family protein [Polyangiaceae bacterium]|nr:H-NS histone family protein [Polyangiaceae bacterium]